MKLNFFKSAHKRALFYDKLAKIVINTGGIAVVVAVIGMLGFILLEGLPLVYDVSVEENGKASIGKSNVVFSGIDEYQKSAYVFTDSLTIDFINLEQNLITETKSVNELKGRKVISFSNDLEQQNFIYGLDSGFIGTLNLKFITTFNKDNSRNTFPNILFNELIKLDDKNRDITKVAYTVNEDGVPTFVGLAGNELLLVSEQESESLFDDEEKIENRVNLSDIYNNSISDFVIDSDGNQLAVLDNKNDICFIDISDKENIEIIETVKNQNHESEITEIKYLIGNQSLIVGDSDGNVYSLTKVLSDKSENGWKIILSHTFTPLSSSITSISVSSRRKNFLVADNKGGINLYYLTSERLLYSNSDYNSKIEEISFAPKEDGFIARYSNNKLTNVIIDNPHPEPSLKTLFGKIQYEGYKDKEYVWQSTGGDDSFEPKLSLTPLIFGTLKGTFYAMLFAIPLALLGALYTSTFSHPSLRHKIKPVVELMAALPSVVIGFIAGLWLAPIIERNLPGFVLLFFVEFIMIIVGVMLWQRIELLQKLFKRGYEIFLLIPLLVLGVWVSMELGPYFEMIFFGGDYRIWLTESLSINYDQRNSIVVGFAMGFAVIPIIFTIAEDSLSSVPQHLSSASLALGASKWQTAIRVVLPTASPGIFSAIMIGFGRAIGETMILLMATGNTPIMDIDIFNGMRTLAANIAVEIPEAPHLGTLYRVLFISAALLFILTFIVNTIAELVRQRLRKKYMHI